METLKNGSKFSLKNAKYPNTPTNNRDVRREVNQKNMFQRVRDFGSRFLFFISFIKTP